MTAAGVSTATNYYKIMSIDGRQGDRSDAKRTPADYNQLGVNCYIRDVNLAGVTQLSRLVLNAAINNLSILDLSEPK
ncbi:hypothetical protein CXB49_10705 [Chromobacterium sp. ATCC 53434]|nr:hypothetical protein CXB49_10705 [Chromobacterium sp. ATCC 53434]